MIVVVSDLHLQNTKFDRIRRREGDQIFETRVARNVGADALSLLYREISDSVRRRGCSEVELVLAGDIFDLHRTPLWFCGGTTLRPTSSDTGPALRDHVLSILHEIADENAALLSKLRAFANGQVHLPGNPTIRCHYILGNHDRLLGLWPETRAAARALLFGMDPQSEEAQARLPRELVRDKSTGYGVLIRHGHEYDAMNVSELLGSKDGLTEDAYTKPALGDLVTVEVATRLAVAFKARYPRELRARGPEGEKLRRMYAALTEFDDVRPQTALPEYLSHLLGSTAEEAFAPLSPVLRDVFEATIDDPFFKAESKRLGLTDKLGGIELAVIREVIKYWKGEHVASIMKRFKGLDEPEGPAERARLESRLTRGDVSLIVAGHTHRPADVALPSKQRGDEAYYVDTGTWRTRIDEGAGGSFGRLRSWRMVFCFRPRESSESEIESGAQRRFESWIGHMQASDYGPVYDCRISAGSQLAKRKVEFLTCHVTKIDEGETWDGAELRLNFGVDDVSLEQTWNKVHNGDTLKFPNTAVITADEALDGEVWCRATELDLGTSFIDRDDPMPWVIDVLRRPAEPSKERTPSSEQFKLGVRQLMAKDVHGNQYELTIRVS